MKPSFALGMLAASLLGLASAPVSSASTTASAPSAIVAFQGYEARLKAARAAVEVAEQGGRAEALKLAAALNELASIHVLNADFDHAEPLFERALSIRENRLGPDHPDIATSLNNLGLVYLGQGRLDKAEGLIFILDEATSSLDSESEDLISKATENVSSKYTSIIIAHRLSTIRHADNKIVIDKGEIIQQGKHEQLVAKVGMYKRLYEIQLLNRNN